MSETAIDALWTEVADDPLSEEARTALRAALDLMAFRTPDPDRARHWRVLAVGQGWLVAHRRCPAVRWRPDTGRPTYGWVKAAGGVATEHAIPDSVYSHLLPTGSDSTRFETFAQAECALALALVESGEVDITPSADE